MAKRFPLRIEDESIGFGADQEDYLAALILAGQQRPAEEGSQLLRLMCQSLRHSSGEQIHCRKIGQRRLLQWLAHGVVLSFRTELSIDSLP